MTEIKPSLKLTGLDGNAFAVLGAAIKALKKSGATKEEIDQFNKEATSGSYEDLLQTMFKYFSVE